jgi:hypothetical protein
MRMYQDGNLNLDDPVYAYLPAYFFSEMTIRDLLCHQSGIAHYSDCPGGFSGVLNPEESMEVVFDCSICLTPPGEATLYTTYGSTLLGVILNQIGIDVYDLSCVQMYTAVQVLLKRNKKKVFFKISTTPSSMSTSPVVASLSLNSPSH